MPAIDFAEDTVDFQEESVPIDFQPEGKSDKYLAMQAEQAALAKKDKGGIAMKALEFAEGVMEKTAHPVRAIMDFPVHLTQALGGQAQTVSTIPFVSPEAAQKAVEFVTPGGRASENSLGQAAQEFAAEMLSGMTSPEMLGTLAVSQASPAAVARYFQGQMLSQVPASVAAVAEAEPGSKEQTKAVLATAANVILPAMIERGMTPAAPKTVLEARAAEVGPASEAVVKGKEAVQPPPEPSVPLATAASESVKPAGVELPALAERPLPTISTETPAAQPAMAERVTELRAPEYQPDIFDLTGWAVENKPEIHNATKYLSDSSAQYNILHRAWSEAGKPNIGEPPKPELVGMGAATPAEYAQTPQTATGIKNRTVDLERAKRDLPPAMEAGRQSFGEAWERAMGRMDKDATYQERLVAELGDKPRAVTDIEDAVLLHRQVDLQNEYGKATRDLAQAFDDGRMEDVAAEQVRVSGLSDQLHELYTINQAVGTETGRGLAARKMMAYEDFSLAKMEVERRAAKGGERLTAEERAEVVTLQNKIETTQKAYDAYVAKTQQQISALEVKAALQATTTKAQETISPKIKAIAERLVGNLEREADAAWKRIQERGITFGSGPLHELPNVKDFAIIGAAKIARKGMNFAQWSDSMARQIGEGIRPHLERIWDESQKMLNSLEEMRPYAQEATKRARKPDTTESKLSFEASKAKKEWQEQLTQERQSRLPAAKKAFGMAVETINTARAILTSADLSAVLRQGGFITLGHPIRALKSFPAMLRAFQSEAKAYAANLEIASRSNYPVYHQAKLYLAEHGQKLSQMEEAYMARWPEKIPLVAGSARAYTTFLNKLRADSFDAMEATLTRTGKATPEEAQAIAHFINVATGRGSLKAGKLNFEQAGPALATVFFSPRYQISRFQLIAGSPLYRGTARTRTLVAKEYARFLLGLGVVYGLGKLAGGEIELDSRSSDFGKIRFGDTRIDPLAGIQQGTVLISRVGSGELKTGKGALIPLRGEKVRRGSPDAASVMGRFIRTKFSPAFGTGVDVATGKNVVGDPVTPESVAQGLLVPLSFRDIYRVMKEQDVPEAEIMALLSILGMGVQTYEPK